MVFYGKPSGSCHACRERKTRCDQIPEGCTQCKRAKRTCPGYRVQGDVIFKHSTTNVIKKIKKKEAKEAKEKEAREANRPIPTSSGAASPVPSESSLELVRQEDTQLSVFSLAPSIEDRAITFFTHHYVLGVNGPSRGHLDYLVDISRAEILPEGLESSMKAVGLAAYAHAVHAPTLLKNARYQYVRAIHCINQSLRDPVEVKKDTTLVSIMVLGIFENVTGTKAQSIDDWYQHLTGASTVIKLRGAEQVKSPAGRRMFVTLVASLLIANLRQGEPLAKHLQEYMNLAMDWVQTPDPAFHILYTMMRLTNLRSAVRKGKLTDGQELIRQALEMDGFLLGIQTQQVDAPGWKHELKTTDSDSPYVFKGHYHVYFDYWIAQLWNAIRTLRIILNEMIRDVLLAGFSARPPLFSGAEYSAEFQISTDVLYEMQLGILYSVPQHLGFPDETTSRDQPGSIMDDELRIPMTGAWFILWPIFLTGVMDVTTKEVVEFSVRTLRSISEVNGIKQAGVLAGMVIQLNARNNTIWSNFQERERLQQLDWGEKMRKQFEAAGAPKEV